MIRSKSAAPQPATPQPATPQPAAPQPAAPGNMRWHALLKDLAVPTCNPAQSQRTGVPASWMARRATGGFNGLTQN